MHQRLVLLALLVFVSFCGAQNSIPDEDWDYVTVRQSAHMFWWLYGSDDASTRTQKPLVLWLQGGPGGSSTGFGNFLEIGPLNSDLQPRKYSWTKLANLLFVDNPVGTGYSYVTDDNAYTVNEAQIAEDLLTLLKAFLNKYPDFQTTPFYIFSESYGGKMAASFAKRLHIAIKDGEIKSNLAGVAMGDSWIRPISFVNTWGEYLLQTASTDQKGYNAIQKSAAICADAVKRKDWANATNLWGNVEQVVENESNGVSFYNILEARTMPKENKKTLSPIEVLKARHNTPLNSEADLPIIMNGKIRAKLGIIPKNVTWGAQSGKVFEKLSVDFMQEVVDTVDYLLQADDLKVVVYSGNLDLICCTTGTMDWLERLNWEGYNTVASMDRKPFAKYGGSNEIGGFYKTYKTFSFYSIIAAGHMVPADQPEAALSLLQSVIES